MATEIRFGLIGLGLMGREFASAAARWSHLTNTDARSVIVAACDTNENAFGWFKQNVPTLVFTTGDYQALLQRQDVQAVYCAVPHQSTNGAGHKSRTHPMAHHVADEDPYTGIREF